MSNSEDCNSNIFYDADFHCRPANENGVWWALVCIVADPAATESQVKAAMDEDVTLDIDNEGSRQGILRDIEIGSGLTPDMSGPDGPVVYFP